MLKRRKPVPWGIVRWTSRMRMKEKYVDEEFALCEMLLLHSQQSVYSALKLF